MSIYDPFNLASHGSLNDWQRAETASSMDRIAGTMGGIPSRSFGLNNLPNIRTYEPPVVPVKKFYVPPVETPSFVPKFVPRTLGSYGCSRVEDDDTPRYSRGPLAGLNLNRHLVDVPRVPVREFPPIPEIQSGPFPSVLDRYRDKNDDEPLWKSRALKPLYEPLAGSNLHNLNAIQDPLAGLRGFGHFNDHENDFPMLRSSSCYCGLSSTSDSHEESCSDGTEGYEERCEAVSIGAVIVMGIIAIL